MSRYDVTFSVETTASRHLNSGCRVKCDLLIPSKSSRPGGPLSRRTGGRGRATPQQDSDSEATKGLPTQSTPWPLPRRLEPELEGARADSEARVRATGRTEPQSSIGGGWAFRWVPLYSALAAGGLRVTVTVTVARAPGRGSPPGARGRELALRPARGSTVTEAGFLGTKCW
jgi:hypothetical protein